MGNLIAITVITFFSFTAIAVGGDAIDLDLSAIISAGLPDDNWGRLGFYGAILLVITGALKPFLKGKKYNLWLRILQAFVSYCSLGKGIDAEGKDA